MGLFAALSGVIGSQTDRVRQEIRAYVQSGRLREQLPKRDRGTILQTANNVTVLYPASFCNWDDVSQFMSEKLPTSVFSFHIHDGDLWMFVLFQNGSRVTQFNTVPNYWEELDAAGLATWTADPRKVADAARVSAEEVAPYLVRWNDEDLEQPSHFARVGDRFPRGSEWQVTDFMLRLGFQYPIDDQGQMQGERFNLSS
jgi:hypothetical protein